LAALLTQTFLEVVAAPGLDAEAEATLATKKNLRVLVMPGSDRAPSWEVRTVAGGFLVQDRDQPTIAPEYWQHMAGPERWRDALADLELAWRTVASVKSNAIVVVKDGVTVGIGGGQTNRVDAARHALERAGERASGAVLASDGFFPFGDVLELCHQHGVRIVVEPGGSIRDQESIDAANRYGITLLFTGMRHFRH
jgi:phosphoribosylaminoimidazolecarboxamide formyltransferase/IMP cyclohydrolase